MTFAAPWFLAAGAAVAAIVVALHLLARTEPKPWLLPTARFVPDRHQRTAARSISLTDRSLLLLRLLGIAAAALGFARPSLTVSREALIRVIVADTSRFVADSAERGRLVGALRGDRDRVVQAGTISAGLLAAIEAARDLRDEADSVAIILVSPLAPAAVDAATLPIRATWPGGIDWRPIERLVDTARLAIAVEGADDDALRAAAALEGIAFQVDAATRLVRTPTLSSADSAWAAGAGRLLVHWPTTRGEGDSSAALVTGADVVVAPFARSPIPLEGRPIAFWSDGLAAAVEHPVGAGCLRTVAVQVPDAGDLVLRVRFRGFLREMLARCGGRRDSTPLDSAVARALVGGNPAAVPTGSLPASPDAGRGAAVWLLGIAIAAFLVEPLLRRRSEAT